MIVRERLGAGQGYDTNLNEDTPFGYIYRMDTSHRHYGPDQPIHQHYSAAEVDKSGDQHAFPRYAMMVLSNVTYVGADKPLWFEGYVSEDTAQRFKGSSLEGAVIRFRFGTFGFDHLAHRWFSRFLSGSSEAYPHGSAVVGRVRHLSLSHDCHAGSKRLVSLQFEPLQDVLQTLTLARNAEDPPMTLFWGPEPGKDPNGGRLFAQDTVQQVIFDDVLL
ncbi:hypothetical protein BCR43DRAFT_500915 [Syncephalastrum racemosum]|uniref:Uncharacterized protein n=1 Tax=Syncephalastrum racemosum TaxID=13706 RepID=A0A1X2HTS7_SYNRA|nr:hypothetical protein BCR43DRAFT_500915 [Syncephalastrum racemosum]